MSSTRLFFFKMEDKTFYFHADVNDLEEKVIALMGKGKLVNLYP